jgi:hypothetical protein
MPGLLAILIGACATVGFILLFGSAKYQRARLWRGIGSALLGFPLGLLSYGWLGIHLARVHHLRAFYSWPFGGERIAHDGPLVASGIFWIVLWFGLLFAASSIFLKTSNADQRR